ncbi:sporulation membrane serine protease [Weissella viridescens]|uniref:S1C family serine protease n=1 Tax=Weissella viridescens TaxID=1629 RepID=UPI00092E8D1B|nr:trypsin-like peptidase domain-containing protein [Weissella viridescens]MCB6840160.1 trypsin-like peptidase domain-containing protein [Weissella viridescens]MCB6846892.1 trypsin-like peptidase domain-containing protein [Weissella viridescens]QOD85940.1 trypsin-like peptidase domain-containing protein [Weissella viridescens]SOB43601.1 sporulation membrane serine protease [Weissella viridescens]
MVENRHTTGSKKVLITALVAGLVGGGISAGTVAFFANNNQQVQQTSNVKVEDSKVKGEASATKAFNKVSGAVVSVLNIQSQGRSVSDLFGVADDDSGKSSDKTASEGSGVIYKKSGNEAYIVTNNHVVSGAKKLQILMSDGTKVSAKLVGTDEMTDLAVLKIDASDVKEVASFADSSQLEPGQTALAIGSPLGSEYATSVTEGIISAPKREISAENEDGKSLGKATVIQTDAAINPGNSGGPLINLAGQVVGINSMKLSGSGDGTSVEGMGFAIPANTVTKVISELEQNGKVTRPSLGISLVDLDNVSAQDQKDTLKLPADASGVVVMKVSNGSAAAAAGLKQYDVITKLDKTNVTDASSLRDALYQHKVGDKVQVSYYRDGKMQTTTVHLTKTQ